MEKKVNYEIIRRLQLNDRSAFELLYNKYSQRIYYNNLKITKNKRISEDIMQDVFILLWEKRQSLDPHKPVINWIFVVSYHKSLDYLKRTLRREFITDEKSIELKLQNKDSAYLGDPRLKKIKVAYKNLSPQKKRVFELCKLQGLTYENAAIQLNISKYTVKEYLSEAMKNIKTFTKES